MAASVQSPPHNANVNGNGNNHNQGNGTSRNSISSTIAGSFNALGARISRVISHDGASVHSSTAVSSTYHGSVVGESEAEKVDRSRSRGRELYSTGRGGAGNIHRGESGGSPHTGLDADVGSPVRGREPVPHVERIIHVGRGGAGNVRSPSREPVDLAKEAAIASREREIIKEADAQIKAVSTGRGGVGNIATDRSRSRGPGERSASRGRAPGVHSSGRGGAGNITSLDIQRLEEEEDQERLEHRPKEGGIHSTGRGGLANLTEKHTPGVEGVPYQSNANEGDYVSQGRGGAGNIRARSRSKEPNHHGGVLSGLADKVHNMHLGHRHSEDSTIKE